MQISPDLKLVLPARVSDKGDVVLRAYHTPIAYSVFEANYRIIAATKAALFSKGLYYAADTAPQIATLRLKDEGLRDAIDIRAFDADGKPSAAAVDALLAEIRRLTLILVPTDKGWQQLPVDAAIRANHIDDEEWREVESQIVFFTAGYAMAPRSAKASLAAALAGVMRGQIASSNPMEFCASLQTPTPVVISTPRAPSSVPT